MNIWPAAQTSPGPLGGAWIGWECRKDVVGLWWKGGSYPIRMYVTVGRDRLCIILWHVVMPPIARGQTWLFQPLPVSTVPNTGRNQSDSGYRGLDEENWHFTKSMSSGAGERGHQRFWVRPWINRRRQFDTYDQQHQLLGQLYHEDQAPYKNFMRIPLDMFDELLTRVVPRTTKQNTTYREALTLRHLVSGTKYHPMSYGWRVTHNTISLFIPKVCQAIIDEYKDEAMTVSNHSWEWRAISDKFVEMTAFQTAPTWWALLRQTISWWAKQTLQGHPKEDTIYIYNKL